MVSLILGNVFLYVEVASPLAKRSEMRGEETMGALIYYNNENGADKKSPYKGLMASKRKPAEAGLRSA